MHSNCVNEQSGFIVVRSAMSFKWKQIHVWIERMYQFPKSIHSCSMDVSTASHFRFLGTTVTYQNLLQGEIKRRLNSGNACHYSVQNILSSRLLS
jgi:hypothetical protein